MDAHGFNWRGAAVFGLAVLTVIALIAVIDDEPKLLGINTSGSGSSDAATTTTVPGAPTTTVAGAAATTTPSGKAPAFDPAGRPVLQQGSTGNDVIFLQDQLRRLGYLSGASDGAFGAGTTTAVIKFQNEKGISPADGVVGPATWTALSTA